MDDLDNLIPTDPLVSRYTDREMQYIFSDHHKILTWRDCWISLAESQKELGLPINDLMLIELKSKRDKILWDEAKKKEKEIRHDVMAHVYAYGLVCPHSKGIIHLGATSQFVVCNTDLIRMKNAIEFLESQLVAVMNSICISAIKHKDLVTLGYTHYQAAQPTTIGKRLTLYLNDLLMDWNELQWAKEILSYGRGVKGTTGTQASFLSLFNGDKEKVQKLDEMVCEKLGFSKPQMITGQTYTRKIDSIIAKILAGIAESAHKFAVDIRLMSNLKIVEEPFEENQTGSSAMPYKRNPMRCERITSLARKLMHMPNDFSETHANQWMERTLDDSAIRRIDVPQMFLLSNAILKLYHNVVDGIIFYPAQIKKHMNEELPFLMTEEILMEAVKNGGDRQEIHEKIKKHAFEVAKAMKEKGSSNNLFEKLRNDVFIPVPGIYWESIEDNYDHLAGMAPDQTEEFVAAVRETIGKSTYKSQGLCC